MDGGGEGKMDGWMVRSHSVANVRGVCPIMTHHLIV